MVIGMTLEISNTYPPHQPGLAIISGKITATNMYNILY